MENISPMELFKSEMETPAELYYQEGFFRDPQRPVFNNGGCFYSPADGFILYQKIIAPDNEVVDVKGGKYTLREIVRNNYYDKISLVIGIFMTSYDVHINRIPYSGILSYKEYEPLETLNRPMIETESSLLREEQPDFEPYLFTNQRVVNEIYIPELNMSYYLVQVADYDIDCITPFSISQHTPVFQGERFSQIRYGSQVDIVFPVDQSTKINILQSELRHVKAGVDVLFNFAD